MIPHGSQFLAQKICVKYKLIIQYLMGLLYTKFYLDFEPTEWRQVSNEPVVFETTGEGVSIEINDTSQNSYRLKFRKGGRMQVFRVVGKFRLTWDDGDLAE